MAGTDVELPDFYDDIADVIEDIDYCLERRGRFEEFLQQIYSKRFERKNLQEKMTEFLWEEEPLMRIALLDIIQDLEEVYSELDSERRTQFEKFWVDASWIVESNAVLAAWRSRVKGARYWTGRQMEFNRNRRDETLVVHSFIWGIDEIHNLEIPIGSVFEDINSRLSYLNSQLSERTLTEGEAQDLYEEANEIVDNAEEFKEIVDNIETFGDYDE